MNTLHRLTTYILLMITSAFCGALIMQGTEGAIIGGVITLLVTIAGAAILSSRDPS
jgi:hypothetical protein